MKAVIRGDFHASKRDSRALFDRDHDAYDVLYIEGRGDTIDTEGPGAPFYLFLMGAFSFRLLYSLVDWVYQYLPGGINIRDRAESVGWEVESNIDADLREMFEETDEVIAQRLLVLTVTLAVFAFVTAATGASSFGIPAGVTSTLLVLLLPSGYFGVLLSIGSDDPYYRDKQMVDSVVGHSESADANSVILFVGDRHVPVLADLLEEAGWDVFPERSTHPIARLYRIVRRLTGQSYTRD